MAYIPPEFTLVQRTLPESATFLPNDGTYNDNYDPKVAQQGESPFGVELIIGTPNSNCYGLYAEPFNECANFLSILQKDDRIVAYYNLIVQNLTGENLSLPFVEGVSRSIFNEVGTLRPIAENFINSVMGQISPNAFWTDPEGNTIGRTEDAFFDPSTDRTGWTFGGDPPSTIDASIQSTYKESLGFIDRATNSYKSFDITGQAYGGGCIEYQGTPFYLSDGGGFGSTLLSWPSAVAGYGPDAIRRNEYRGNYFVFEGEYIPSQLIENATFYNMCLEAKECIKEYKQNYPDSYNADVAALTDEQIANLSANSDIQVDNTNNYLNQALDRINLCYSYATDRNYYNKTKEIQVPGIVTLGAGSGTLVTQVVDDSGKLNQEVLYRVAISIAAIRNIIILLLETVNGFATATTVSEYNDYVDQIEQELQEEYDRNLAEAEARRLAKAQAMAERMVVCREADPAISDNSYRIGLPKIEQAPTIHRNSKSTLSSMM
jgi:hypothetical protein